MRPALVHLVAVAAALAACASDEAASSSSPSSFQRPASAAGGASPAASGTSSTSAAGAGPVSSYQASAGKASLASFPKATRDFMERGLHQFSSGDPQWEDTRARWIALGPAEASFLVSTLWAALLRSQELGEPGLVERARHELALVGEPSVPLLVEALLVEGASTAGEGRGGIDDAARGEASEILGLIGAPAAPAVADALERAPSKSGRLHALRTLGFIGDRGGSEASAPLLRYARAEDFVLRVEAVSSMQFFHDDATRAALLAGLGDEEELVRTRSAEALVVRGDLGAVPYLRSAAAAARERAHLVEATEMDRLAAKLEKSPR